MIKSIIVASSLIFMISTCIASDMNTKLQEKTSQQIEKDPRKINISNIKKSFGKVVYDAEIEGSKYNCYYTTSLVAESDSLCHSTNYEKTEKKQASCNALTRAAGQCE